MMQSSQTEKQKPSSQKGAFSGSRVLIFGNTTMTKGPKLFSRQVKILVFTVTKVQGRNVLRTARKSMSCHNGTLLWDQHSLPLLLQSQTHSGDGWSLLLFSAIKLEGGSKCSYADILSTNANSLLGSNPQPLTAGYTN